MILMLELLVRIIVKLRLIFVSSEYFSWYYSILSFHTSLWYPIIWISFLPKKIQENFLKIKTYHPRDCNHCTPITTSTPPIGMESIVLLNTYFPMVSLILWHFPENFIVPPFATISWHFVVGYRKKFNSLVTLQWIKLWVLPKSVNTITFLFLICPSILRVWVVVILANALKYMVGFVSYFSGVGCWCISSSFYVIYSFSSSSS